MQADTRHHQQPAPTSTHKDMCISLCVVDSSTSISITRVPSIKAKEQPAAAPCFNGAIDRYESCSLTRGVCVSCHTAVRKACDHPACVATCRSIMATAVLLHQLWNRCLHTVCWEQKQSCYPAQLIIPAVSTPTNNTRSAVAVAIAAGYMAVAQPTPGHVRHDVREHTTVAVVLTLCTDKSGRARKTRAQSACHAVCLPLSPHPPTPQTRPHQLSIGVGRPQCLCVLLWSSSSPSRLLLHSLPSALHAPVVACSSLSLLPAPA